MKQVVRKGVSEITVEEVPDPLYQRICVPVQGQNQAYDTPLYSDQTHARSHRFAKRGVNRSPDRIDNGSLFPTRFAVTATSTVEFQTRAALSPCFRGSLCLD